MTSSRLPAHRLSSLTAAAVTGTLLLAGCGTGQDGTSAEAGGKEASGTRTVTDAKGTEVKVPAAPERVVTLSEPTLDAALSLGFQPVGATSGRGQQTVSSYLTEKAGKAEIVATVAEPDLEKLARLRPDLILLDETVGSKRVMDKLRAIAPTVLTAELKAGWKKALLSTADALNKREKAEKWLEKFEEDVRGTRSGLGSNAKAETSVIRWQEGGPSVVGKGEGHVGSTLAALGLTRPKGQQGESLGRSEPVSLEKLDTIDGDWLFFGTLEDAASGRKALKEARKVPNFERLNAVERDHVAVIEGSAWNSAGGPIAARTVLKDVKRNLTP
ncbi:iron complex transport system substrate-binding protein [Streptomyces sp. WMMB 714]|uniref:ABC transporter substrate-binding protein n=1 Tax=Streptomyces sp. WMMB 714 TaxID=1286822 RepID=UPI0005F775A7|nr:ABC transporter substrate-binding protein [Streptomyces sp. WMMB 714]SCK39860.1 iron complex transport system substrate-binding protein [Streptomyces sp. WMMB 714]